METTHRLHHGDARDLGMLADDSVELVVTSPPYPMVEMWDETFTGMDAAIGDALDRGDGPAAYEAMHRLLDEAWAECARVLTPGGIACVNVGDATRSVGDGFRVFPNHARVLQGLEAAGFEPLPGILWRKPTNAATKFMGSGMLPPNAYPTLEHEHLLVCRLGATPRSFPPGDDRRYASAYFWEERNAWFSDVWTGVRGASQALPETDARDRSGAFPLTIPYRLITMFSVYGDTVLDPFCGTGTTVTAAALAARNSVGVDADAGLVDAYPADAEGLLTRSRELVAGRLDDHRRFVEDHRAEGGDVPYEAVEYDFPVKTKQERQIRLLVVDAVEADGSALDVVHRPVDPASPEYSPDA